MAKPDNYAALGEAMLAEIRVLKADAARWRFVRDHGLVWLTPPFDGCTEGLVADGFATRYVDYRIATNGQA